MEKEDKEINFKDSVMEKEDEEINYDFEATMEEEEETAPNGGLLLKLRLPKAAAEEDRAAEKGGGHNCRECSKSFSSGKALGGHMSSAHVQASKDYSYKKLNCKNKTKRKQEDMIGCPHCDKTFPTDKSLFGHMRCHPDRQYRGMEPPRPDCFSGLKVQPDSGSSSTFQDWPSTSKRGRGYVRAPETFSAGHQLLKLINGGGPESNKMIRTRPETGLRMRERDESIDEIKIKGKGKVGPENSWSPDSDTKSELYRTAIEVLMEVKRGEILKGEKRVSVDQEEKTSIPSSSSSSTTRSPEKYICDKCGKSFDTHQALGGHRSSHNKFKLTIVNTRDRDRDRDQKDIAVKNKKQKKQKTSAASNGGNHQKVVLEIDLNVTPEDEDEDEEDVNGEHCI